MFLRSRSCCALILGLLVCFPPELKGAEAGADAEQAILDLHDSGKLFNRKEYKTVRQAFAQRFEAKHGKVIREAYEKDYDDFTEWLNQHLDIKEDFYTALDEKHDKLPAALRLFRDIWKKSPAVMEKYPDLAIAVAVVWDDDRHVYDYRHHQERTKSTLPEGAATALDNFNYLVDNEKVMQGRAQFLPWEFLVYLVDHRTPLEERKSAQTNYVAKRTMFGRCYADVPYDYDLLAGKAAHLDGQSYTLDNIRSKGGVCSMQADFAARVGKSIGVPAIYVTGQANNLELHAWVMWVELKQVTKTQIVFTLESHGRYFGDHYFTGDAVDPQTGQRLLDRDVERRLGVVGLDRTGKRQADFVMRAYPLVLAKNKPDAKGQVAYLNRCLKVSVYNEAAWLELARMTRDGKISADDVPANTNFLDMLVKYYVGYPDFVWKVYNDLLPLQTKPANRDARYEQLITGFERLGRADLACEARMKLVGFQLEDKKEKAAATGLALTIKKFPDEGRHISKLVKKLEEVCGSFKGGTDIMSQFYQEWLPTIPRKRGYAPNKHCIAMYEQAITFFKETKKDQVVKALEGELGRMAVSSKK